MGYWGRPHLPTNKTLDALASFTYLPAAHFFSHLAGSLFSLSLCLHHGTYIFLFFFSSDVKSVYCVLLTTTLAPYPIFKFQKTAQGGVWETLLCQRPVRQEGQQPNNHLKDHTQFSRFSSILFAWKERD